MLLHRLGAATDYVLLGLLGLALAFLSRMLGLIDNRLVTQSISIALLFVFAAAIGFVQESVLLASVRDWAPDHFCHSPEVCHITWGYRLGGICISFYLGLGLLSGLTIICTDSQNRLERGEWLTKTIGILLLAVMWLVAPEWLVEDMGWLFLAGAVFSMVAQAYLVSEMCFGVNHALLRVIRQMTDVPTSSPKPARMWTHIGRLLALIMFAVAGVLVLYGYTLMGEVPQCHLNHGLGVVASLLVLVSAASVTIPHFRRQYETAVSLLPLAAVVLYYTDLFWMAGVVYDRSGCTETFATGVLPHTVTVCLGCVFAALVTLQYGIARNAATEADGENGFGMAGFYVLCASHVCYALMLLNNWSVVTVTEDVVGGKTHDVAISETWVPFVVSITAMALCACFFFVRLVIQADSRRATLNARKVHLTPLTTADLIDDEYVI